MSTTGVILARTSQNCNRLLLAGYISWRMDKLSGFLCVLQGLDVLLNVLDLERYMRSLHLVPIKFESFDDFECVASIDDSGCLARLQLKQSVDYLWRHISVGFGNQCAVLPSSGLGGG